MEANREESFLNVFVRSFVTQLSDFALFVMYLFTDWLYWVQSFNTMKYLTLLLFDFDRVGHEKENVFCILESFRGAAVW